MESVLKKNISKIRLLLKKGGVRKIPTSSLKYNVHIDTKEKGEQFEKALEQAENQSNDFCVKFKNDSYIESIKTKQKSKRLDKKIERN